MTSVWCRHHHWANSEAQHGPSAVPPVPPSSPKCSSPDSQQPPDPGWLSTFHPNTSSSEFYPFSRTLAQSAPHTVLPVPPSLGIHSILDLPVTTVSGTAVVVKRARAKKVTEGGERRRENRLGSVHHGEEDMMENSRASWHHGYQEAVGSGWVCVSRLSLSTFLPSEPLAFRMVLPTFKHVFHYG